MPNAAHRQPPSEAYVLIKIFPKRGGREWLLAAHLREPKSAAGLLSSRFLPREGMMEKGLKEGWRGLAAMGFRVREGTTTDARLAIGQEA